MGITTTLTVPERGSATFSADMYTLFQAINAWAAEVNAMTGAVEPAEKWVPGSAYVTGNLVWSPVTYLMYRRKTDGTGITDPSADSTNWQLQVISLPDQTGNSGKLLTTDGSVLSWTTITKEGAAGTGSTFGATTTSSSWQTLSSPVCQVTVANDNPKIFLLAGTRHNTSTRVDFRREISGGSNTDAISGLAAGLGYGYSSSLSYSMMTWVDEPSVSAGDTITYKINYKSIDGVNVGYVGPGGGIGAAFVAIELNQGTGGGGGGGGTSDHGVMTGLGDDDHTQYHNDSRANTWLETKTLDDIASGVTSVPFTTNDEAKLDFITVTQAVDLDQMEIDIAAFANGMVYKGAWDASGGSFPGGGSAQTGWFYYVNAGGTVDGVAFAQGDNIVATTDNASATTYTGNWSKHDQTDAVQSVAGKTGNVTLDLDDVSETAGKKVMTAAERTKLSGMEAGADVTDSVNVNDNIKRIIGLYVTDPDGNVLTAGDGKGYITIPAEYNAWDLINAEAAVTTVSGSGNVTVQLHNATDTQDMLSTAITIEASEYNSATATTQPVINTTYDDVATGDRIRVDIDAAGMGAKGLQVFLTFQKS